MAEYSGMAQPTAILEAETGYGIDTDSLAPVALLIVRTTAGETVHSMSRPYARHLATMLTDAADQGDAHDAD